MTQYVVEKGYIAIDGTSLTVVRVEEGKGDAGSGGDGEAQWGEVEVMLIQYTQGKVTLPKKRVGDAVNLEADIMGKQIVAYLSKYSAAIRSRL